MFFIVSLLVPQIFVVFVLFMYERGWFLHYMICTLFFRIGAFHPICPRFNTTYLTIDCLDHSFKTVTPYSTHTHTYIHRHTHAHKPFIEPNGCHSKRLLAHFTTLSMDNIQL